MLGGSSNRVGSRWVGVLQGVLMQKRYCCLYMFMLMYYNCFCFCGGFVVWFLLQSFRYGGYWILFFFFSWVSYFECVVYFELQIMEFVLLLCFEFVWCLFVYCLRELIKVVYVFSFYYIFDLMWCFNCFLYLLVEVEFDCLGGCM